jgi:hypothetical protein
MFGTLVGLGCFMVVQVVGGVVWGVNQKARIDVLEKAGEDTEKLVNVQLASIDQRLSRIEKALNGSLNRG